MTEVRTDTRLRGPGFWLFAAGALALASPRMGAAYDLLSDPFRTDSALERRAPAPFDLIGRDCALPGGALTLPNAVNLALCRNPATRAVWAQARQQAAALGSAESAWAPTISATGAESRTFGDHVDVSGTSVSSAQNTGDVAVNLSWLLYDFGGRSGRIRSASRLLDAAALTANSVAQQIVLNVIQNYFGVVAADADLAAARIAEANYTRSLEVARARREGGAATLADVLQIETAFDQAVLARVQAEKSVQAARGLLAVTIGAAADQRLMLEAQAVPAEVPAFKARIADLMAEAASQRPDLAAAKAQRDAAEADVTVARAAGRPSISIGAGHDLVNTTGVPRQNYSTVGVTLTVPVFTGYNVTYNVRQAQAVLEQREANVEQARLGVSLDVWNGYYALESANQQLTASAALSKSAEENEQVALGRYQAGVGTMIDLLTAQAAAVGARQQRIQAELGWQVARAQLALALGRLSGTQPLANLLP